MTQPPASLMSQEEGFRGTHGDSFSPSLSPNMCAEHPSRLVNTLSEVHMVPQAYKSHIDTAHSCQQHPVLPSDDLSLCQSLDGLQRIQGCLWQVPCNPCKAFQGMEGRGRSTIVPAGPGAGLPAVHKAFISAWGHG